MSQSILFQSVIIIWQAGFPDGQTDRQRDSQTDRRTPTDLLQLRNGEEAPTLDCSPKSSQAARWQTQRLVP